jgi:hypothetical protein
LPKIWIGNSLQILFADDSCVAITNSNIVDFQSNIKAVFEQIHKCPNFNLSLEFDKTDFIPFKTKKNTHYWVTVIKYDNRQISNILYTNFLCITSDNTLYWKTHIDLVLPKPSSTRCAIRVLK